MRDAAASAGFHLVTRPGRIISSPQRDILPLRSISPDLILRARQPKHGADGFRFAEASGHIDSSAIGQRYHLKLSERRLNAAFLFGRNAGLFEVEFALDAPARFVGDLTVAQELVDVFAFQGDQIGAHVRRCRSRIVLA
jgi:hypothetical protein